jgi:hypothetical protein
MSLGPARPDVDYHSDTLKSTLGKVFILPDLSDFLEGM